MGDISKMTARTGRTYMEDGNTVNIGDLLTTISSNIATTSNNKTYSFNTALVTVQSTASTIGTNTNRVSFIVTNTSLTEIIYWGLSGVTSSTGMPILPYDTVTFDAKIVNKEIYFVGANSPQIKKVEVFGV
jgi:hypothetical protein